MTFTKQMHFTPTSPTGHSYIHICTWRQIACDTFSRLPISIHSQIMPLKRDATEKDHNQRRCSKAVRFVVYLLMFHVVLPIFGTAPRMDT